MAVKTENQKLTKVILFTFPSVPTAYSISPFALKVESYLRINEIPYDVVYTSKFGPKGKIPYVHIHHSSENGKETVVEVVPDSNVILSRLEEIISPDSKDKIANLSREEKAMAHAVTRMLEEHTSQIGFHYRYTLSMKEFFEALDVKNYMFDGDTSRKGAFIAYMFMKLMPKGFAKKMKARGLSSHSDNELWKFSNDDLLAVSNYLGGKKYFFGKEHATSIDCTIFGHLSQFLFIPLDFPQKQFLEEQCPNIILFMERFKAKYWSDWEQKCERKANQMFANPDLSRKNSTRNFIISSAVVGVLGILFVSCRPR